VNVEICRRSRRRGSAAAPRHRDLLSKIATVGWAQLVSLRSRIKIAYDMV
jgi:hypothetical protein